MKSVKSESTLKDGVIKDGQVIYICEECKQESKLSPMDQVRCKACGYRVLLMKRKKKIQIFDAR